MITILTSNLSAGVGSLAREIVLAILPAQTHGRISALLQVRIPNVEIYDGNVFAQV